MEKCVQMDELAAKPSQKTFEGLLIQYLRSNIHSLLFFLGYFNALLLTTNMHDQVVERLTGVGKLDFK